MLHPGADDEGDAEGVAGGGGGASGGSGELAPAGASAPCHVYVIVDI